MTTTQHPPTGKGEQALADIGFDGKRLMRLANRIAKDYLRSKKAVLTQHRLDELESFLVEHALRAAIRYDPARAKKYGGNGGDPVSSYLADIMERRCVDWYRSKSEGNGDRRYGNDGRVFLAGDMRTSTDSDMRSAQDDHGERERLGWYESVDRQVLYDMDSQTSFNVEREVSRLAYERWKRAAALVDMSLYDFVVAHVDRAANRVLDEAA